MTQLVRSYSNKTILLNGGARPALPAILVEGASVTRFSRDGVNYTQVMWRTSGSLIATEQFNAQYAIAGGGGSGGAITQVAGAGGAGQLLQSNAFVPFPAGEVLVSIGAGGAGGNPASPGSDSVLTLGGVDTIIAGGGVGGGTGPGGDGGCGGGGGTNSTSNSAGGIGSSGGNGGAAFGSDTNGLKASGGGGGMGGDGEDAASQVAGNGGPGVTLTFTEPPMDVCGGGGGIAMNGTAGTATHGGTAGNNTGPAETAVNGGGGGANKWVGAEAEYGGGGDGFFVMVVRSEEVNIISGPDFPPFVGSTVAMGDSITVGAAATAPANRWVNIVTTELGSTLVNAGIGGTVLQNSNGAGGTPLNNNGRDRYESVMTGAAKRELGIVAYGFNDARYTAAPATFNVTEYINDYREIITGLLAAGYSNNRILIVGPHYITDAGLATGTAGFTGQTREGFLEYVYAARQVAYEFQVLYFDSYHHMEANGGASLISEDDIHPNNQGHAVIADGILRKTFIPRSS